MSESKEQQLWDASTSGNLELVSHLANDPAVDVNWGDSEYDRTAFYRVCSHNRPAVVKFLLKHPRVDVNKQSNVGATPFYVACQFGHTEVVTLLLADVRIDVNEPQKEGATPFEMACQQGQMSSSSASSTPAARDPDLQRLEERFKDEIDHSQNLFWNCIEDLDSTTFDASAMFRV